MPDPVDILRSHLGYHEGPDNANIFSAYLNRPPEYWCFDTVTAVYDQSGHRLPSMQPGCKQGAAAVISGVDWAKREGFWIQSWEARRNDAICFDHSGHGDPQKMHIALVEVPAAKGGRLTYIGGNQGDRVTEEHATSGAPPIMGAIALSRMLGRPVRLPRMQLTRPGLERARVPEPRMPVQHGMRLAAWAPAWPLLMLKTPTLRSDRVRAWQQRMRDRGWLKVPAGTPYSRHPHADFAVDGEFGVDTAAVAWAFQQEKRLEVDGKIGPQTWAAAARTDNVTEQ